MTRLLLLAALLAAPIAARASEPGWPLRQEGHAAAALADGRVLIAGGLDAAGAPVGLAGLYDPATGAFARVSQLETPRAYHSATLLADGRVLIAGGWDGRRLLDTLEIFEPASGSFTRLEVKLWAARAEHAALSRQDGSVLFTGGRAAHAIAGEEVFDPAAGFSRPVHGEAARLPALATDKPVYAAGETIHVGGGPFQPGETVVLLLDEEPLQHYPSLFSAVADGEGLISDSSALVELHERRAAFRLTARGATSGVSAQALFADAGATAQIATGVLGDPNQGDDPTISVATYVSYPASAVCGGAGGAVPLLATIDKASFATLAIPSGGSVRISAPSTAANPGGGSLGFNTWTIGNTSTTPSFANSQSLCLATAQAGQLYRANYRPSSAGAAPIVTPPADQSAIEGIPASFSLGSFIDAAPGASHWTVTIDWGDGNSTRMVLNAAGKLGTQTHSYADNGNYRASITVVDSSGLTGSAAFTAIVANANPAVGNPGDQTATEGVARSFLLGSFGDTGVNDGPWTILVDWGDGSSTQATSAAGIIAPAAHSYARAGVFNARVTVTDKDGGAGSASFLVAVANVAPVITAPPAQSAVEGASAALSLGSFTDAALDGPWTVTIDWGDGASNVVVHTAPGILSAPPHVYADNGVYLVTLAVKDAPGASSVARFAVSVANAPPLITAAANQTVQQLISSSLDLGSFSDAGANDGPWAIAIDWGDGAVSVAAAATQGGIPSPVHAYSSAGSYVASVKVTDKDGGAALASFRVVVLSSAPALQPPVSALAIEGVGKSFPLGSFSDPTGGPWSGVVAWGDGSQSTFAAAAPGLLPGAPHTYLDNGTYRVAVTLKNGLGLGGYSTFDAVVANALPVIVATGGQQGRAEVASAIDLGSFSDSGAADSPWVAEIDWGDGSTQSLPAFAVQGPLGSAAHLYHSAGDQLVTVYVTDKDGGRGQSTFTFSVAEALEATIATGNGRANTGGDPLISIPSEETYASADCSGAATVRCTLLAAAVPDCADPAPAVIDVHGSKGARFLIPERGSIKLSAPPTGSGGALIFTGWTAWDGTPTPRASGLSLCVPAAQAERSYRASYAPPLPPVVSAPASQLASEGTPASFNLGSFSDAPVNGPWVIAVDWGDGTSATLQSAAPGAIGQGTHAYADNGNYAVTVAVLARDGLRGVAGFSVAVANLAPTAVFTAPAALDEGGAFSLSFGGAKDASPIDMAAGFRYSFDCGDGAGFTPVGPDTTRSCATFDSGSRVVRGRVFDKDSGFSEYSATVAVREVAPTATFAGPASILEGTSATFAFTDQRDPSGADLAAGLRYAYSCEGGSLAASTYAAASPYATVSCLFDDGPASKTVRARIIDRDGAFTEYTASIQVRNVAPVATLVVRSAGSPCGTSGSCVPDGLRTVDPGGGAACKPAVVELINPSDPSRADTLAGFRYSFECTGASLAGATYANSSASATKSCSYASAGLYPVRARIIDKDGGFTESIAVVNVGGRMTGGGTLPGKISHGLELHCDPGAGPNELEVNWGAGRRFHLDLLDAATCSRDPSVVVAHPAAHFNTLAGTGTGRVDGALGYTISFSLTDGGPGTSDRAQFLIKSPAGAVVLSAGGNLVGGDQVTHDD